MKWEIQGPDGKTYEVEGPDGATEADVMSRFKAQFQPPPKAQSALGTAGVTVGSIGGQFNEGVARAVDLIPTFGRFIRRQFDSSIPELKSEDPGGVRTALKSVNIPVGDLETQKREYGVEDGPIRRVVGTAAKIAGQSVPFLPMGPVGPGLKATGYAAALGAAGREVGGETGETIGVLASLPAALRSGTAKVAAPQSTGKILDDSTTAFDAFKAAPAAVHKSSFGRYAMEVGNKLRAEPIISQELHPKTLAIFQAIEKKLADPNTQGLTMGDLWGIRRSINNFIPKADSDDARLLLSMKKDLNKYLGGLKQSDALFGDVVGASANLRLGIQKYAQGSAAKEVEDLIQAATLYTQKHNSVSSGQALRQMFWGIAKNPDELRRFSPEVQKAIKLVATGSTLNRAFRFLGKFDPTSRVIPALALGAGASSGMMPLAVGVGAVGLGSKIASNAMTKRNAKMAAELIRRGYPVPPSLRQYINPASVPGVAGPILGQTGQ